MVLKERWKKKKKKTTEKGALIKFKFTREYRFLDIK